MSACSKCGEMEPPNNDSVWWACNCPQPVIDLDKLVERVDMRKEFLQSWRVYLEEVLSSYTLPVPKDGKKFGLIRSRDLVTRYANVLEAMALYESGFEPGKQYTENFKDSKGNYVISTGLFQLSTESLRGYGVYLTTEELKDPYNNIEAAVKVFLHWVNRDKVISRKRWFFFGAWRGPAKYWSTLRGDREYTAKALAAIKNAN